MLKSISKFLGALCAVGSKGIDSKANQLNNYLKDNIDFDALIADYKSKTDKELLQYNNQLDAAGANYYVTCEQLNSAKKELDAMVADLKKDKDNTNKRLLAENKLKIVKVLEASCERQGESIKVFREKVTEAKVNQENTLSNLKASQLEYSLVKIEGNLMSDIELSTGFDLSEIQDIITGKKALIRATRENDELLNRKKPATQIVADVELSKELDELINS